jgi:hypothetical protein
MNNSLGKKIDVQSFINKRYFYLFEILLLNNNSIIYERSMSWSNLIRWYSMYIIIHIDFILHSKWIIIVLVFIKMHSLPYGHLISNTSNMSMKLDLWYMKITPLSGLRTGKKCEQMISATDCLIDTSIQYIHSLTFIYFSPWLICH